MKSQDNSLLKDRVNHTINSGTNQDTNTSFEEEESLDGITDENDSCVESELATLKEVRKVFGIQGSNDSQDKGKSDENVEEMLKQNDYFILFLDPESRRYYRKIIGRDDYIRLEPLEEHSSPDSFLNNSSQNRSVSQIEDMLFKDHNKIGAFYHLKDQYE